MESFSPATRTWFAQSFDGPTPVQAQGWPRIASGEHSLLIAPTGSGKTLAAFLWCIDRLIREPQRVIRTLPGIDPALVRIVDGAGPPAA